MGDALSLSAEIEHCGTNCSLSFPQARAT
jgi:hypothetical protein